MKTVNSHNIEFGYELLSAVPYAYELYLKGGLSGTVSGKLSEPLYYFSPNHTINPEPRSWYNTAQAASAGLPYTHIHKPHLQPEHFPPYKERFANTEYKWKKPTLCICNRANVEWMHSIINYFDADILEWLFENLKSKYEIVYFPILIPDSIQDNGKPVDVFDDIFIAKKHGVKVFTDIMGDHWNEAIMKTFANCEHYITMNGGYSILASYFTGQNIIYSKPGMPETKELKTGSFWRWYANINNVQTLHVPSYEGLKRKVKAMYIQNKPTAHVLIRTSNRPNAFRYAIGSVLRQSYENINIVVICDDKKSIEYTQGYPCRVIIPETVEHRPKPDGAGKEYSTWFPPNDYLNQAQRKLNEGYIFFLDDDDMFLDDMSIQNVIQQAEPDKLAIWKVQFPGNIIPNGSFGITPTLCDVTGIGLCYHTSQIRRSDWTPWKCADYRTAKGWPDNQIIWINEILTGLQSGPGRGLRLDTNPQNQNKMATIKSKNKSGKVKVQFLRKKDGYTIGNIAELPWIVAANYIHRGVVLEMPAYDNTEVSEPGTTEGKTVTGVKDGIMGMVKEKEEKKQYQTKEDKPTRKRTTKKVKDETDS